MIRILYGGKELGYISWLLPPLYIAELVKQNGYFRSVKNVAFALSSFIIHIWLQWPYLRSEL